MLFQHQQDFVNRNPNNTILAWEGGTGKTRAAVEWLRLRSGYRLVVCPKRVKAKWQKELDNVEAVVLTKEEFVKLWRTLPEPSAVVIDEADEFASPLFIRGARSKRSEAMYNYLSKAPYAHRLLLTATPVRSTPWNMHTLMCFLGVYVDWKVWQSEFFELARRPFLPRPAWFPKADWRRRIRTYIDRHCEIVLMKDCVGVLPPATEVVHKLKSDPAPPELTWHERHRLENANKVPAIEEIISSYRKAVVVVYYREQMEQIYKAMKGSWNVYQMHGGTKDQEAVIAQAQADDECVLLVQASLVAGYDLDTFSIVVFASMSFKVADHVQMKFRVRRIHNLHPVAYHYLLAGPCDRGVYNTVMSGKDFVPSEYASVTEKETEEGS